MLECRRCPLVFFDLKFNGVFLSGDDEIDVNFRVPLSGSCSSFHLFSV